MNINISNRGSSLDRMPRENVGASYEDLSGPYERLQAQYGSWQSSVGKTPTTSIACVMFLMARQFL